MEALKDTYRHQGLRKRMIEELRVKKIADEATLAVMERVPRHLFFPDQAFLEKAYEDIAFKIGSGQTISHPSTVAIQTSLLKLQKGDRVLEIGTGSGYQAAVLLEAGVKVFSIERQHELFLRTRQLLHETLKYSVQLKFGDGYLGWPAYGPFDKIIITAGAPYVPQELVNQLKPGGRMVIPVGEGKVQQMHTLDKSADGTIESKVHGTFSFVPLLEDRN